MSEELEYKIQESAKNKDKNFRLSQIYKKPFRFIRKQYGFEIYAVDAEWIRNNLGVRLKDMGFEHAGHGFVHEFIPGRPQPEIWVATRHYEKCGCNNVKPDLEMSKKFFESTVIHEIIEFKAMEAGIKFKTAHKIALAAERKIGILKDPYTEEYD